MTPLTDPYSALVYSAQSQDVRTVIIAGEVIMKDRVILTMDEAEVIREFKKRAERRAEGRPIPIRRDSAGWNGAES